MSERAGKGRRPLSGVRVLEIAQFTFVPSAGAVLADWGAEVVKVEPVTGDTQRRFTRLLKMEESGSTFAPIMDGPNRSKRSIGLGLDHPEAHAVLARLIESSDVVLTNYLPQVRRKLGIDVDDVRAINQHIIYAVGSGFGQAGPDAEAGAYDATAFWARGGSAFGTTPPAAAAASFMPSGAYGDSLGGLALAGGVAAALLHRDRHGESSVIDVSLLSVGAWATQLAVNQALMADQAPAPRSRRTAAPGNPLTGNFRTSDERWIQLSMLQVERFWEEFCAAVDRHDLTEDPRFVDAPSIAANADAALDELGKAIARHPLNHWRSTLAGCSGPWAVVQDPLEVGTDPALIANARIGEVIDESGTVRQLVANPVSFNGEPVPMTRAPQLSEHADSILAEIGIGPEDAAELRALGALT